MTDRTQHIIQTFLRDDAGSPLGAGMPSGGPLRADGQSHYEAWLALVRRDPCAYCGAGWSGTVDHVEPRSRSARGVGTVHSWVNTVGACARCNGSKRDSMLLAFLHRRRWNGAGGPVRVHRRAASVRGLTHQRADAR